MGLPPKTITVVDTFVCPGNNGDIAWVDGYIDNVRFVGYPNNLLVLHGKLTESQKETARRFCRSVF